MNLNDVVPYADKIEEAKEILGGNSGNAIELIQFSDMLEVPPKVVWQIIERLRQEGYNILVEQPQDAIRLSKNAPLPKNEIEKFDTDEIVIGIVSDTHLVSIHANIEGLQIAYELFARNGVTTVYHVGNCLDGEKTYPGQEYELLFVGFERQIEYFVERYPKIDGITTKMICSSSCHEGKYYKMFGMEIGKRIELLRHDIKYLGLDEADILFGGKNGVAMKMMHPGGGTSYALSYKPQKIVESFSGGEKPNILLLGHYHKMGYFTIRNVHVIMVPCLQRQTNFMRKRNLLAMMGAVILKFKIEENSVIEFTPKFIPFY